MTAGESFNNFTPRAQQALALARKEADRLNHNFLGTEHMLLGIIKLGQGTAVNVLRKLGLDLASVGQEVEKQVGTGPDQTMVGNIPYTPRVKKVIELAQKEARQLTHAYVGTEHLLLGLIREGDGVAAKVLASLGVELEETREEILCELDPNFAPDAAGRPTARETGEPRTARDTSPKSMDHLTPRAQKALRLAGEEVKNFEQHRVGTEHLLLVDLSRRYDVYCIQHGERVVYRNVLFKACKGLFARDGADGSSLYLELEQSDGKAIFIAKHSVFKFCDPGAAASGEPVA